MSRRAPLPARLLALLDNGAAPYRVLHHPLAYTAQELAAVLGVPGRQLAKVVVVRADQRFVLLVLPAERRVDLAAVTALLGAPVRFATETEFTAAFPDCQVGAMPPFGELSGLPTYADASLAAMDWIVFEAGAHSDAIKLAWADYVRLARPQVADFAVKAG